MAQILLQDFETCGKDDYSGDQACSLEPHTLQFPHVTTLLRPFDQRSSPESKKRAREPEGGEVAEQASEV